MRGIKTTNSYQNILSPEFLEKCPKSVLAAIAVSFTINHQNFSEEMAEEVILNEWHILHKNGTIPQKPHREVKNRRKM